MRLRASLVPDRSIIRDVVNKLARGGIGAPRRVMVQSRPGEAPLAGSVQFVHPRQSALRIAKGVDGASAAPRRLTIQALVKS